MTGHPNTFASVVVTAAAGLVYHYAQHYGWVSFTAEDGILAVGAVIAAVHFVGRRGIWPTAKAVWFGVVFGSRKTPGVVVASEPPTPPASM